MAVTVQSLMEAGVHFGHQTRRWNPQMAPYLFGERGGVHIIDLDQTLEALQIATSAVEKIVASGGSVLFVGTKRQGKAALQEAAAKASMPYVTERWLGGLLTNFPTIKRRLDVLNRLAAEEADGDWNHLPKKEAGRKLDALKRLQAMLGGMKDVDKLPEALFVNDVVRESLAIAEAKKLGLPIIGVLDSNADPRGITYPIPANDDAVKAIQLIADEVAEACLRGKQKQVVPTGQEEA